MSLFSWECEWEEGDLIRSCHSSLGDSCCSGGYAPVRRRVSLRAYVLGDERRDSVITPGVLV